jgi:hypothetical protein
MQLELPKTREEIGVDAILQDERRLIALLEAVAIKLNRSVDSVRRELSLHTLNEPRSKSKLEDKGRKISWIDVEHVSEPGEYKFRDGIIRIKRKHLNTWKTDPDATFTLVRFLPSTSTFQIYGLYPNNFLEGERRT